MTENLSYVRVPELDEGPDGVFSFAELFFEQIFHSEPKYVFTVFVSLEQAMEWDLTKSRSLITFVMSASEAQYPEAGGSNLPLATIFLRDGDGGEHINSDIVLLSS